MRALRAVIDRQRTARATCAAGGLAPDLHSRRCSAARFRLERPGPTGGALPRCRCDPHAPTGVHDSRPSGRPRPPGRLTGRARIARGRGAGQIADLGAGAGFPGCRWPSPARGTRRPRREQPAASASSSPRGEAAGELPMSRSCPPGPRIGATRAVRPRHRPRAGAARGGRRVRRAAAAGGRASGRLARPARSATRRPPAERPRRRARARRSRIRARSALSAARVTVTSTCCVKIRADPGPVPAPARNGAQAAARVGLEPRRSDRPRR